MLGLAGVLIGALIPALFTLTYGPRRQLHRIREELELLERLPTTYPLNLARDELTETVEFRTFAYAYKANKTPSVPRTRLVAVCAVLVMVPTQIGLS